MPTLVIRYFWPLCRLLVLGAISLLAIRSTSVAEVLVLQNGMRVRGIYAKVPSLSGDLFSSGGGTGGVDLNQVIVVDDGLRRVFFSTHQKADLQPELETLELIRLDQPVSRSGSMVGQIGSFVQPPTDFDEFGRRRVTLASSKGPLEIIQGITEITPVFTRVQSLQSARSYEWDLRLATSSLPRETLSRILKTHLDRGDVDERLSIVRLYLQSKRYEEAAQELEAVIADFPDQSELGEQLAELRRLHAQMLLNELTRRQSAGQHQFVEKYLGSLPANLPAENLLQASELQQAYARQLGQRETRLGRLGLLADELQDGATKSMLKSLLDELHLDLNFNTIDRLDDFERLADDAQLTNDQKSALAVSGWLTGGFSEDNLPLASSLWRMRDLVRRYLNSEHGVERDALLKEMGSEEANTPKHVAHLLAAMKPPLSPPISPPAVPNGDNTSVAAAAPTEAGTVTPGPEEPNTPDGAAGSPPAATTDIPGLFEFTIPGAKESSSIRYVVQLPPEYDPQRRYPTIVSLHAASSTPEMQVDWWAGTYEARSGRRNGQATRHGYIVIAPQWATVGQKRYNYSAQEHAAVLFSLRDALHRFAIDTDRVFLSGHYLGGDAAWDLALAHPDIWAGAIMINATAAYDAKRAPKYVSQYWTNAQYVPLYFVGGERDVARLKANARDLNRYLTRPGFDTMVVEYLGHTAENFYEEVQTIFEWMELHRRNFSLAEFNVLTMRPWDNFFWWAEVDGLPPGSIVLPAAWPEKGVGRPTEIKGAIRERKNVALITGAGQASIYLGPDQVDFQSPVTISVNGKTKARSLQPDVKVLLEDARRRGDRLRPFWARVDVDTGRRSR